MKKKYLLSLDEKETDELKEWLAVKGVGLSGFFNSVVHEHMDVVKTLGVLPDVEKVTLGQFVELAQKMLVNLKAEVRAKKV